MSYGGSSVTGPVLSGSANTPVPMRWRWSSAPLNETLLPFGPGKLPPSWPVAGASGSLMSVVPVRVKAFFALSVAVAVSDGARTPAPISKSHPAMSSAAMPRADGVHREPSVAMLPVKPSGKAGWHRKVSPNEGGH